LTDRITEGISSNIRNEGLSIGNSDAGPVSHFSSCPHHGLCSLSLSLILHTALCILEQQGRRPDLLTTQTTRVYSSQISSSLVFALSKSATMPTFPSRTYADAAKSSLVKSDLRKQVMSQSTSVDKSAIPSSSSNSKEIGQVSKVKPIKKINQLSDTKKSIGTIKTKRSGMKSKKGGEANRSSSKTPPRSKDESGENSGSDPSSSSNKPYTVRNFGLLESRVPTRVLSVFQVHVRTG
jgi:hypothetical protein